MDAVTNATSAAQSTAAAAKSSGEALQTGADFQTFLTLLTTQLRNQDPLNPQDSTEFVAQLAQFSGVEQQIRGNETLERILSALGGEGPERLAPWIGREVEAAAPLPFDGETPVELRVDPEPGATAAHLVVKTEAGATVARLAVDPPAERLSWDGDAGSAPDAPAGTYSFTLERSAGDERLPDSAPRGFAKVVEARLVEEGVELTLEGGARVDAAEIRAIRGAGD